MIHTDGRNDDQTPYDQPTKNDIACVFRSTGGAAPTDREFVFNLSFQKTRNLGRKLVIFINCHIIPYPTLFFFQGDPDWSTDMMQLSLEEFFTQPSDEEKNNNKNQTNVMLICFWNILCWSPHFAAPAGPNDTEENLGFGLEGKNGNIQVNKWNIYFIKQIHRSKKE